jgi:hypothetical protein
MVNLFPYSKASWIKSITAERLGIMDDQSDGFETFINNIDRLGRVLREINSELGVDVGSPNDLAIPISSGFRCYRLNKAIGGSKGSKHQFGLAVDLDLDGLGYDDKKVYGLARSCMKSCGLRANSNFMLFYYIHKDIKRYEIDQLILEYGSEPMKPAWVHLGLAEDYRKPRHQMLRIYKDRGYRKTHLIENLESEMASWKKAA